MIKALAIILLLTSCGSELDSRDFHETDPEFKEYIELFSEYYGSEINDNDVVIGFGETKEGIFGLCNYSKRQITISRKFWDLASDSSYRKEALIFHELGHCVLNLRGHETESIFMSGMTCPKSLMNPALLGQEYSKNRDYYIHELFNR
jgi:hypothetical protein